MAYTDKEKAREYARAYQREHRKKYKLAYRNRNREIIKSFLLASRCYFCGSLEQLELAFGSFAGKNIYEFSAPRLRSCLEKTRIVCVECKNQERKKNFNEYRNIRRKFNSLKVDEYLKSHPCIDCGESNIKVLEFDHRDPQEKRASLSHLKSQAYSLDALQEEISKCDVRCINCHHLKHIKRSPEVTEYLIGKACIACGENRPEVLHFDHRDPTDKRKKVGELIRKKASRETIETEISKCDIRCAKCHRLRHVSDKRIFYQNRQNNHPNELRSAAFQRFTEQPNKCFQRHMREILAEQHYREPLISLDGASVKEISWREAKNLIIQYEWLGTMAAGIVLSYGLYLREELIGAVCFNRGAFNRVRDICGSDYADRVLFLCRGACVPWAPKNAASYLIRHSTKKAFQQHGYSIFVAYSDSAAGEIGTVYQAVGWNYIGYGSRDKTRGHIDMVDDEGKYWSSYAIWKNRETLKIEFKIADNSGLIDGLENCGWKRIRVSEKTRYVWFEGPDKKAIARNCRYPFLSYPKRDSINGRPNTPIIKDSGNARTETRTSDMGADCLQTSALD